MTLKFPCGQVNFPRHSQGAQIRTLEWKHMMEPALAAGIPGTLVTTETPCTPRLPSEFEYPFPDHTNATLYRDYRELAQSEPDVLICGRLGEYRYFDMDQAIGRAMLFAQRILAQRPARREQRLGGATEVDRRALLAELLGQGGDGLESNA